LLLYCSRSQGKCILAYLGSLGSLTLGPIPFVTVLFKEPRQVCLSLPWFLGFPHSRTILPIDVVSKGPRQVCLSLPWFLGLPNNRIIPFCCHTFQGAKVSISWFTLAPRAPFCCHTVQGAKASIFLATATVIFHENKAVNFASVNEPLFVSEKCEFFSANFRRTLISESLHHR
jgi:hypothetical protein